MYTAKCTPFRELGNGQVLRWTSFLQMFFGHRSVEALRLAFPDVLINEEARSVLKTLFPT